MSSPNLRWVVVVVFGILPIIFGGVYGDEDVVVGAGAWLFFLGTDATTCCHSRHDARTFVVLLLPAFFKF